MGGVAICYQDIHMDDAFTLFYSMIDRDGNGNITAQDVIEFVKLIENDSDEVLECDVDQFCQRAFGEDVKKQLRFDEFVQNVMKFSLHDVVQHILQFIIFTCLEIRLDEDMVVVSIG